MPNTNEPEDEEFDRMTNRSNSNLESQSDEDHVLFVDVGAESNEIPFEPDL